jgi:hypothetical protein
MSLASLAEAMGRENAFSRANPALLKALRVDELAIDQRHALFAAIELLKIPPHVSEAFVSRAEAGTGQEYLSLDRAVWGTILMKIARIDGTRERRDAVRSRLLTALRVRRLAACN